MIEFSPQIVLGQDEHRQWPRDSQQIDERFFDKGNDVRKRGVWSSMKWLSDGQLDELNAQRIFEQSINSLTKTKQR
jgi:hypothetical protein